MADDSAKTKAANDLANLTSKPTPSLADIAEEYEEEQSDFQAMYDAGGDFAGKLDEIAKGFGVPRKGGVEMEPSTAETSKGKAPEAVMEIPTEPELENKPELEGYIEKVEKDTEVQPLVVDDYTGQILLKPSTKANVKVILPLTEEEVQKGLHHQIWDSIRWLAEWCMRQLKLVSGKAEYKKNDEAIS